MNDVTIPAGPPGKRASEAAVAATLILLATLPYANTLFHSFVYDDTKQVLANPYVQSWSHLPEIFSSNVWSFLGDAGVTNHYRPLMTFSYLLCWQFFGPLPFGFHLVNLVFHAAVVWILYRLTAQLFVDRRLAFAAAMLFALHPIHTESVAWVAGITDLQLAFFYLLTFHLYLQPERPGHRAFLKHVKMGAAFLLTLLSKEIAVTLPLLATLFEHGFREDRRETTRAQKVGRYAPLWGLAGLYVLFRIWLLGAFAPLARRELPTWGEAVLSGFALSLDYVWKLLWPVKLCAFYVFDKSQSLWEPKVLGGIAVLAALACLLVALWRKSHAIAFSLLWMAVTLAPVMNARWMAANVFAERYLYLPSVGFCWLLAWAWAASRERANTPAVQRGLVAALCALALLYAGRTLVRNRDWRDDETLYTTTLQLEPRAYLIRNNLGTVYWNRGDEAAAVREWQLALAQQPEDVVLLNNLGLAAARQKRHQEAEELFRRAIRIRPAYSEPYFNLGRLYEQMGREADAEREYHEALARHPLHTAARNALGALLFHEKRYPEAIEQFRAAIAAEPTSLSYAGLGETLMAAGDLQGAANAFRQALQANPYELRAHLGLGRVLVAQGRMKEALPSYEAVLQLDPQNPEALSETARLRENTKPNTTP